MDSFDLLDIEDEFAVLHRSRRIAPVLPYLGCNPTEVQAVTELLGEHQRVGISWHSPQDLGECLISPLYWQNGFHSIQKDYGDNDATLLLDLDLGHRYTGFDVLGVLKQEKEAGRLKCLRSVVVLADMPG